MTCHKMDCTGNHSSHDAVSPPPNSSRRCHQASSMRTSYPSHLKPAFSMIILKVEDLYSIKFHLSATSTHKSWFCRPQATYQSHFIPPWTRCIPSFIKRHFLTIEPLFSTRRPSAPRRSYKIHQNGFQFWFRSLRSIIVSLRLYHTDCHVSADSFSRYLFTVTMCTHLFLL
jgi:hypothetical protein